MRFAFKTTIFLNNEEIDVEVSGKYTPGTKGSYDEPPEAADADIHSIMRLDTLVDIDVPDDIWAELQTRAYDEACEQYEEDYYDDYYEDDDRPDDDEEF